MATRKKSDFIVSPKGGNRKKKPKTNTVAIMSAKPGYRMKSYGPMSLLPLGSHNLVDIQISAIKSVYKSPEILLCCGFGVDKIAKYVRSKYRHDNIRIVENQRYEETNCCETLRLCLNNTNSESILVCNGDMLLYPELVKTVSDESYILTQKKTDKKKPTLEIGSVCDEDGMVTNITFGLPNLWSEIFHVDGRESINNLRRIVSYDTFKSKLIFEALNELNKSKYRFKQIESKHKAIKINNIKTYHQLRDKYENLGTQLFLRSFN